MNELAPLARDVGIPVAILIFILWTGARGLWVYGRTHEEMKERCSRFEELALRSVTAAEAGTETAKQLADERARAIEIAEEVARMLRERGQGS